METIYRNSSRKVFEYEIKDHKRSILGLSSAQQWMIRSMGSLRCCFVSYCIVIRYYYHYCIAYCVCTVCTYRKGNCLLLSSCKWKSGCLMPSIQMHRALAFVPEILLCHTIYVYIIQSFCQKSFVFHFLILLTMIPHNSIPSCWIAVKQLQNALSYLCIYSYNNNNNAHVLCDM